MNNEFDSRATEHDKISQLYHSLKQELPSPQVDQSILARAKLQGSPAKSANPTKTASERKTASTWRQWQWPVSIAASVLLVSVIFIEQYPMLTDTQATYPEAVPLEIEAFNVPAPPPPLPDNTATMQQDGKSEQRARPAASATPNIAEQQSAYLAAKREVQQQTEAASLQRQQVARIKPADINIGITSQIKYLQNELASKQAVLATINKKRAKILLDGTFAHQSETSVSLTLAEQQELEQQIADLQSQLIKQMGNKQRLEPDWQVPPSLLNLLSAEQQAKWLKPVSDADQHKQENKQ